MGFRTFKADVLAVVLYGAVVVTGYALRLRDALLGYAPPRPRVHPGIARLAEAERRIKAQRS